jgi:hypothetical protein
VSHQRNDSADTTLVDVKGHSETLSKRVQELKDKRDPLARELKTLEEMEEAKVRNGERCQANNGFIVSTQVEIGNVEHTKLHSIVDSVEKDFDAKVTQVLVDSAYTTGENLKQASNKNLVIVGPIAGLANDDHPAKRDDLSKGLSREDAQKLPMSPQNKQFDRLAFIYDAANDLFYCPAGKQVNFRCTSAPAPGARHLCDPESKCWQISPLRPAPLRPVPGTFAIRVEMLANLAPAPGARHLCDPSRNAGKSRPRARCQAPLRSPSRNAGKSRPRARCQAPVEWPKIFLIFPGP